MGHARHAPGRALTVARCGRVPYDLALAWQEALVARRIAGGHDALLLLEHPAVYTLGRGADARFLGAAGDGTVQVVRVGRGGQVTYHGPGQLVGYPILGLRALRPDVRWYVRSLEAVLIDALGDLGIQAERRDGLTGVWVGPRKIGSIGVSIRRWVTWHGFALNVGADLSGFSAITPCGIEGVVMTSIAREGRSATMDEVSDVVLARFLRQFGYSAWQPLDAAAAYAEAQG
jgi:lipoate-protein ligase B